MDLRQQTTAVVYICWDCGEDFEVTERDGLTDSLEVTCPDCGSESSDRGHIDPEHVRAIVDAVAAVATPLPTRLEWRCR